ncbi:MAG: hypothetical protein J6B50_03865 [Lachnospiraceae bacterium]|nr:hypothetical protein [Lachnospiraceae bacterium]
MAVVKTIQSGNTIIRIHDDAYRDATPEELAARRKRIQDTVDYLATKVAMRQLGIDYD